MRPRVWFGERWVTSVFDLFEENTRYFPALLPICDDDDPVAQLDARRDADAGRAVAAQRHGLPVEPADLRRRRRPPAPAGGEPRAASRADGRRRRGQRGVLLRAGARAGRAGAADLVADVVLRGGGEPAQRAPATASTRCCTGRHWARSPPPSWCCAGCCRWRTRGLDAWGVDRPCATGCSASSRGAARPASTVPCGRSTSSTICRPPGPTGRRPCTGCWSVTSEHAQQRTRAHLATMRSSGWVCGPPADPLQHPCRAVTQLPRLSHPAQRARDSPTRCAPARGSPSTANRSTCVRWPGRSRRRCCARA